MHRVTPTYLVTDERGVELYNFFEENRTVVSPHSKSEEPQKRSEVAKAPAPQQPNKKTNSDDAVRTLFKAVLSQKLIEEISYFNLSENGTLTIGVKRSWAREALDSDRKKLIRTFKKLPECDGYYMKAIKLLSGGD